MSDSANQKEKATVVKCAITVTQDASGINAKYNPEIIPVTENNTHIHFHIDAKSSDGIEIESVSITPGDQTQLVDQQYDSNRQLFKLKDLNTVKGTFVLGFQYRDKGGKKLMMAKADCDVGVEGVDVPQINNNPPG